MDIKSRVELSMDEASEFSAVGTLRKKFDILPDGLSVGHDVLLGHWKAEVASIEHYGSDTEHEFIVGFRMRF